VGSIITSGVVSKGPPAVFPPTCQPHDRKAEKVPSCIERRTVTCDTSSSSSSSEEHL
jgi:hypothetical protein